MDYKIGSLADLITGKNTPNKTAVIRRKLTEPTSNSKPPESIRLDRNKARVRTPLKKAKKESTTLHKPSLTVIDYTQVEELNKTQDGDSLFNSKPETDSMDSIDKSEEDTNPESGRDPLVEAEINSRTVFVGNIATTVTKKQLMILFGKFGKVQCLRFRCATAAQPGISKKLALMKKMLHPKRTTLNAYVVFESLEDALKSIQLNGKKYKDHYLRVQMCSDTEKPDPRKAIFVGNLPFDVEDDDLWAVFDKIGNIKSVRVVRNSQTGMGIGIGYVNFTSTDCVELALQLEDVVIKNNTVRIKRCNESKQKHKERKRDKQLGCNKPQKQDMQWEEKPKNRSVEAATSDRDSTRKTRKLKHNKSQNSLIAKVQVAKAVGFQGTKSNKRKKKHRVNKGSVLKMKLSQKIAPR